MATLLGKAGREAERRGDSLYLVGGGVRDLLLGATPADLDLVVEGPPLDLARAIAVAVAGRAGSMTRFGTCRIDAPGGIRIDLAMARRERYAAPARLPDVEPATIAEDLLRRDFTVNSVALCLTGPCKGGLIDPSGGERDLRLRLLRLHHPSSLVDDPTRAFRGARYARRFSLKPAPGWSRAIESAVRSGAFGALSAARLRTELSRIGAEDDPAGVLALCARWGLLSLIHAALRWTKPLAGGLRRARDAGRGAAEERRSDLILALLVWSVPSRARGGVCDRLGLEGSKRREVLLAAAAPARAALLSDVGEDRPHGLSFSRASVLARWPPLSLLTARVATTPAFARRLELELRCWERSAPRASGDDLVDLGVARGPRIGRLLRALRRERFNGRLRTLAGEMLWLRRHS